MTSSVNKIYKKLYEKEIPQAPPNSRGTFLPQFVEKIITDFNGFKQQVLYEQQRLEILEGEDMPVFDPESRLKPYRLQSEERGTMAEQFPIGGESLFFEDEPGINIPHGGSPAPSFTVGEGLRRKSINGRGFKGSPLISTMKEVQNRSRILYGELLAGNKSKNIVNEFLTTLDFLYKHHKIDNYTHRKLSQQFI